MALQSCSSMEAALFAKESESESVSERKAHLRTQAERQSADERVAESVDENETSPEMDICECEKILAASGLEKVKSDMEERLCQIAILSDKLLERRMLLSKAHSVCFEQYRLTYERMNALLSEIMFTYDKQDALLEEERECKSFLQDISIV